MKNNIALKYGLIAGVGVVAYFLLFYCSDIKLFFNPIIVWGSLVVYIAGMVKACVDQRKMQAEFPFKDALRTAFFSFAVASVVYYVFNYLLYNVFDAELAEVQKEILVEQMGKMATRLQFSDVEDQIKEFSKSDFRVTIGNSFLALGQSLIGGFILSLAVSAVMRR